MAPRVIPQKHIRNSSTIVLISLVLLLVLSACGGDPQTQQRAVQSKGELEKALTHAKSIGVPDGLLLPITQQMDQLYQAKEPLGLFTNQPQTEYYTNLSARYQTLTLQVRGLETQITEQLNFQAAQDMEAFGTILAQRQAEGFVQAKTFAGMLAKDQEMMAGAKYPKDYLKVSANAKSSTQALKLLGSTYDRLTKLQQAIKQLESSKIDATALNQMVQYDIQLMRQATTPEQFTSITNQINSQLQQAQALSTQAIPYVGEAKLKQFQEDIDFMKQFGEDVSEYQKKLDTNRAAFISAKTVSELLKVSAQIDKDMASIQLPMLRSQANHLLKQYHDEVKAWGSANKYLNAFDNKSYELNYSYMTAGLGEDLDAAVFYAETSDEYKAAITLVKHGIKHLDLMKTNYGDKTSWDQPHKTDLELANYYDIKSGQVIIVSLLEQTMRIYQDGKLIKSFLVVTGQYNKPTPPGIFHVYARESPTKFKSSEPKGSAFWYPDTKITYAMLFREGGYYIHDAWWRLDYGPGNNFPHYDSGGDQFFAGDGSHGCVNMPTDQAQWIYQNTTYGTAVIIY